MTKKDYTKETQKTIKSIEQHLTAKYGEVQPQWETVIMLLADNLDLYTQCKESIKENGIYNTDNGKKNPLLATLKDLQATIMKQVQHLGISPYAFSKIKVDVEDDTEDYIEGLIND